MTGHMENSQSLEKAEMETVDLLEWPGPCWVGTGGQGRPRRQSPSPGRHERGGQ